MTERQNNWGHTHQVTVQYSEESTPVVWTFPSREKAERWGQDLLQGMDTSEARDLYNLVVEAIPSTPKPRTSTVGLTPARPNRSKTWKGARS